MDNKIKFSDLSGWLKFGIIGAWIITFLYIIVLIIGFLGALA